MFVGSANTSLSTSRSISDAPSNSLRIISSFIRSARLDVSSFNTDFATSTSCFARSKVANDIPPLVK